MRKVGRIASIGTSIFVGLAFILPSIELGLDGSLDVLDGVVFPSTCDVISHTL